MTAIYNEDAPAGFDLQIQEVQTALSHLPFVDAIFGASRLQMEIREGKGVEDKYLLQNTGKTGSAKYERWYPQGNAKGSKIDLTPDDSYTCRIFFVVKDPISTSPKEDMWDWSERNPEICQPFSLILHCSLQKIFNLNCGILNQEQVKICVLYALNSCAKIKVKSMSENITNIWKEYSMTPEINGFSLSPFYALRIEVDSYYYPFPVNGSLLEFNPATLYINRVQIGWKVCTVVCLIVDVLPNPVPTQILANGDIIPNQYLVNLDGTVTMPYLNSVAGISLLSRFLIKGEYFEGNFFINGNLNTSQFGNLGVGDYIMFDASLPEWNIPV